MYCFLVIVVKVYLDLDRSNRTVRLLACLSPSPELVTLVNLQCAGQPACVCVCVCVCVCESNNASELKISVITNYNIRYC